MKARVLVALTLSSLFAFAAEVDVSERTADLGMVIVEGSALSKYRPETTR